MASGAVTIASESPLRRALYRALHDPLTGLANRALLMERLGQVLGRAEGRPGTVAVFYIDLDRFKLVNDSLGHAAGDQLLVEVARRLEASVRSTDTVARVGGDEFVVLATDVEGEGHTAVVADRLREVVSAPVELAGGHRVVVTASIGVAIADNRAAPAPELLWDADAAMYRAKECGRDRSQLFTAGLRAPALDRFRAEVLLRRALEGGRLRLHYQPIIDVASGLVAGAEALVRLDDPERGIVGPGEFIGAAEESGLIVPLGAWVIDEACRQASRWHDLLRALPGITPGGFTVAVNLSARQLAAPGFAAGATAAMERSGVTPSTLCFEVTENALLDASGVALRTLGALKAHGARIAIDDFGTGFSSLTWLRHVPADQLKVDRSFVAGLGTDSGDTAIVRAVLGLGRALGLTTVAEGVETPEQFSALRDLGCDLAQGFHFARPGPAEAITEHLQAQQAA